MFWDDGKSKRKIKKKWDRNLDVFGCGSRAVALLLPPPTGRKGKYKERSLEKLTSRTTHLRTSSMYRYTEQDNVSWPAFSGHLLFIDAQPILLILSVTKTAQLFLLAPTIIFLIFQVAIERWIISICPIYLWQPSHPSGWIQVAWKLSVIFSVMSTYISLEIISKEYRRFFDGIAVLF